MKREKKEKLIKAIFLIVAFSSIMLLMAIMFFLFNEGLPIFKEVSFKEFIFGEFWYPTSEPADFGIFPLIVASVLVTLFSALISVPLGVMMAIYLSEIANKKVCEIIKPVVELIASLPSVVIGFFGMIVVGPFLQDRFGIDLGLNLFNVSLMLAFMSIPTICTISEDAIHSVPISLREASFALGATKLETIIKIVIPASISGIITAIILGMSRTIGETMVALMVAGGAAIIPISIFDPVRPMPASIVAEMAEAPFRGTHYNALFAIGIVLFLFVFLFNLVADHISNKYSQTGEATL